MPELPEVETIVRDLNKKVLKRAFIGLWTNTPKIVKNISLEKFEKEIKNKKIKRIFRKGKNIIFELSENFFLLVHQKMTGHLLYGEWEQKNNQWTAKDKFLKEKDNSYLRLIFFLDNKKMLALSDLRKFAKVELWPKKDFFKASRLDNLGIEPLDKSFTFKKFKEVLQFSQPGLKPKFRQSAIKKVLMDQKIIVGIGNIYADKILWQAKIHPLQKVYFLTEAQLKSLYKAIGDILKKAIKLRGSSVDDYRDTAGQKGSFQKVRKVYQRQGEKCPRCGEIIKKIKIASRGSCYCPKCQKI